MRVLLLCYCVYLFFGFVCWEEGVQSGLRRSLSCVICVSALPCRLFICNLIPSVAIWYLCHIFRVSVDFGSEMGVKSSFFASPPQLRLGNKTLVDIDEEDDVLGWVHVEL